MLRGKCITLNKYGRKIESLEMRKISFHLKNKTESKVNNEIKRDTDMQNKSGLYTPSVKVNLKWSEV